MREQSEGAPWTSQEQKVVGGTPPMAKERWVFWRVCQPRRGNGGKRQRDVALKENLAVERRRVRGHDYEQPMEGYGVEVMGAV